MLEKRNTRLEVYKLIEINKSNKEIAEELNISIRTVERYRQEHIKATSDNDKKATTTSDKKKRKEIAKAKIITGASLKEATEQTGTTMNICKKLSSKENLQQSQREFLQNLRDSKVAEIKENKLSRFNTNKELLIAIKEALKNGEFNKELQQMLLKNEETEQEIFELSRLERLERFEFDKEIYTNKLKIDVLEKIKTMTDEELKNLIEYMESKAQS